MKPSSLCLVLIIAAAAGLRFWGLGFGLPNINCRPDETILVDHALAIGAGDFNPHFFNYPTFHFYLLTLVYGLYFCLGYAGGIFADIRAFQHLYLQDPSSFYLIGRALSAVLGTASVGLVYAIGRHLGGERVGLLGAAFLAGAFLHVRDSHFLTVDIAATFHVLLAYCFALRYCAVGRRANLLLAGLFAGLAVSTKYNMALLMPGLGLAVWFGPQQLEGKSRQIVLLGAVATAAFILGSPYIVLDFPAFWRDFNFERLHAAQGHGIDLGRGWWHHLSFSLPLGLGWPLWAAGILGLVCLGRFYRRPGWVLLSGVLVYYGVAGSSYTVFVRYMVPIIPFLCLAAAVLVDISLKGRSIWPTVLAGGLLVAPSAYAAYQHGRLLVQPDTRLLATHWIEEQIPSGTRLALVGDGVGYPTLARSREWLTRQWEDRRARGAGQWLEWALSWGDYPPTPNYNIVELRAYNPLALRSIWTQYSTADLRRRDIRWVVVHLHPLAYSAVDTTFAIQLEQEGVIEWEIDPFKGRTKRPVYDPIDAYYTPLAGFQGVARPGPALRIYRLP